MKLLKNPKTFFDVAIGGEAVGRLTFEIFADKLPITAENFRALCTGETGRGYWRQPRHYKYTKLHRVIPGFMCQGGDYNCFNGYGGESIYGQYFRDERFLYRHSKRGLLSMAKHKGKDTNNSQFFITFDKCPWLDGKHVVFGHVIDGIDILSNIEREGTEGGRPKRIIEIYESGELTTPVVHLVGQKYENVSHEELRKRAEPILYAPKSDGYPIPKSLWIDETPRF